MIGTMRLGMMTPADIKVDLPKTYELLHMSIHDGRCTFYTKQNASIAPVVVEWLESDMIRFSGKLYKLIWDPSHRIKWNTFTIAAADLELLIVINATDPSRRATS